MKTLKMLAWDIVSLAVAFGFGVIVMVAWCAFFFRTGFRLPVDGVGIAVLIGLPGTIAAGIHTLLASLIIYGVWRQHREMLTAIALDDERAFTAASKVQIPSVMHLFMAVVSACLLTIVAIIPYGEWIVGAVSMFIVAFLHAFFLMVAILLNDPLHAVWSANVPEKWVKLAKESPGVHRLVRLGR